MNVAAPTPAKVKIDTRVEQYIKLRDKIRDMEEAHKKQMAPLRDTLEQLNSVLLQHLQQVGVDSARTQFGTVYRTMKQSASIADAEAFWTYVVTTASWDLLDRRANVTGCAEYMDNLAEKQKTDPKVEVRPPPGVNFNRQYVVGVRRA